MPSSSNEVLFNQKTRFPLFRANSVNIDTPRQDFGVNSEGQYILIHDSLLHPSFNCFFVFSFRNLFYDNIPELAGRES